VVILFRDGLEVEGEMLRREWHLPLRALVLAMPITAAIVAVAVAGLTDLSWTQAFLVGALLLPWVGFLLDIGSVVLVLLALCALDD